jgi:hypothetical protein
MTITKKDLETLATRLRTFSTGEETPIDPSCGICWFVHCEHPTLSGITRKIMMGWPKATGDKDYPVPHPTMSGEDSYSLTDNLWIKEYGDLRRELCLYLSEELLKHVVKDS